MPLMVNYTNIITAVVLVHVCRLVVLRLARTSWPRRLLRPSAPKAPIQTLPAELLQIVFEHAAAGSADKYDAVNTELIPALMGTCKRFRDVALDAPFLWSFVTFKWVKPKHSAHGKREIFNRAEILLRLERSKQTNFHLLVHLREADVTDLWIAGIMRPFDSPINDSMDELKELLRPHMRRCSKVEVVHNEMEDPLISLQFPSFFPLKEKMPELRTIIHDAGKNGGGPLLRSDISAPALQNIVCCNAPLFKPSLGSTRMFFMPVDWLSNLTTLEVQSLEASRLETFTECARLPNLRHLRLTHYYEEHERWDETEAKYVHFPELQVLSLRGASTLFSVEQISAPHLKILEIAGWFETPYFFAGSHFPALEIFHFWVNARLRGKDASFILRHPTITTLTLGTEFIKPANWPPFFAELAKQKLHSHVQPLLLRCLADLDNQREKHIKELVQLLPTANYITVEWMDSTHRSPVAHVSSPQWKWSTGDARDDATETYFKC